MVMRAYVDEHGKNARYQLTRLNKHIKLFDYYELRGEAENTGSQDSGLLTPSGKPRGGIFGIYRHKTR